MKKSIYHIFENTRFMLSIAYHNAKSVIVLSILLAVVTSILNIIQLLISPLILQKIEHLSSFSELIITILILSFSLFIFTALKSYIEANTLFGRITVRKHIMNLISSKVASTAYAHILDNKFINYENKAYHVCSSNSEATEAIWNTLTEIFMNVICFIIYLFFISSLNAWMIVLVGITTLFSYFFRKKVDEWSFLHKDEEVQYEKRINYLCRITTNRQYAKDIRIFHMNEWIEDVFHSTMNLYKSFLFKRERIFIWAHIINVIMILLRNGIAYAYLIYLFMNTDLEISTFLLYLGAISGFASWIVGIFDQLTLLHNQCLDISTILELLNWPEPNMPNKPLPLEINNHKNYEIKLENVSYRYPYSQSETLKNINLCIHPGEKIAVVGMNGAGKTTLIKIICGFLDPTNGRVLLNNIDIRQYDRKDYYRLFSAVFQDSSILEASIEENVSQTCQNIDRKKVWKCLEKAELVDKIKTLPEQLETKIGRQIFENGVEFSGGQIQRLMLARALYKDAPILVLDEPTSALDPIAENNIYLKYNEMSKGKLSIFISHRLASTQFCDRILLLDNGQIIEEGSHDSLLQQNGKYAYMFDMQSQYYRNEGENHEK